jgi:hypothetical protein
MMGLAAGLMISFLCLFFVALILRVFANRVLFFIFCITGCGYSVFLSVNGLFLLLGRWFFIMILFGT